MSLARITVTEHFAALVSKHLSAHYGNDALYCAECGRYLLPREEYCKRNPKHEVEFYFQASFRGEKIRIPFSKLETRDPNDMLGNLAMGIAWVTERYELRLPGEG